MNAVMELRRQKATAVEAARALLDDAEAQDRALDEGEQRSYDEYVAQIDQIDGRIRMSEQRAALSVHDEVRGEQRAQEEATMQAPAFNQKTKRGDSEEKAWAYWVRTGDQGALMQTRASNDTDMNITTPADGGNAVPVGHFQTIIARRDEGMLASKLGVRRIPGQGTTVNVPLDGEDDGEFVSTAESAAFDRDAPAIGKKAFTLVKYSKKVDLTVELLRDEDATLLAFLADFVGRGMAKTHNSLLLTEVGSNGTSLLTFASATAIAAGEPEDIIYQDALSMYLDDSSSVAWVTRPSTFGNIVSITGSSRLYGPTPWGNPGPQLCGYPVHFSHKVASPASTAKSIYFGNWNFVGMREGSGFSVIRDPYTRGAYGEVLLYYMFDAVYGVLQAEAIGYAKQAT